MCIRMSYYDYNFGKYEGKIEGRILCILCFYIIWQLSDQCVRLCVYRLCVYRMVRWSYLLGRSPLLLCHFATWLQKHTKTNQTCRWRKHAKCMKNSWLCILKHWANILIIHQFINVSFHCPVLFSSSVKTSDWWCGSWAGDDHHQHLCHLYDTIAIQCSRFWNAEILSQHGMWLHPWTKNQW